MALMINGWPITAMFLGGALAGCASHYLFVVYLRKIKEGIMKINNETDARAAIQEVCEWLGQYHGPRGTGYYAGNEDHASDLAREFAQDLLDAGRAEGCGGCDLCRG